MKNLFFRMFLLMVGIAVASFYFSCNGSGKSEEETSPPSTGATEPPGGSNIGTTSNGTNSVFSGRITTAVLEFISFTGLPVFEDCKSGKVKECACPGGGLFSLDDTTHTVTYSNCKTEGGATYTGTIIDLPEGKSNGSFPSFGNCTNVTMTGIVTEGCGGAVSATCGDVTSSCEIIAKEGGECNCK